MALLGTQTQELLEGQAFRDAMAQLAAPVTVVTGRDGEGRPWGFTASSVISLSLEPPRALVSINRASSCHAALTAVPELVVNVLGVGHRDLALRFARHGVDRFAGGEFVAWPGGGAPYLPTAAAAFRCVTTRIVDAGDHDLLFLGLIEARSADGGDPLLWYRRGFRVAARPAEPSFEHSQEGR